MSTSLPYDLCARVQNAFRARHAHVAVAHTRSHLGVLSVLLRAGFLASLSRGTASSPGPSPQSFLAAQSPAEQRIWAELKYRDDRPVLRALQLVSKPSKRVYVDVDGLRLLCSGRRARNVKPLGMGEVAVVRTEDRENEWLEAREALRLGLAGEIVCRAR